MVWSRCFSCNHLSLFLWATMSYIPCGKGKVDMTEQEEARAACHARIRRWQGKYCVAWVSAPVCAWLCMCVLEKRTNKRERKREREVWYHQLNNPPTQHLVLSLSPSVPFPTITCWFSAFHFFSLFLSFSSLRPFVSPFCVPLRASHLPFTSKLLPG